MTRPLGKSPARASRIKSSQLELNQASLIDVRAEDDDLLPGKKMTSPQGGSGATLCPRPGTSPLKVSAIRTLACIQEDPPESGGSQAIDEIESRDVLPPLTTEDPVAKKKKKKSGFNLRKSLAWNNAFFTEEGVLDPEELVLVNRTFKKPLKEPKPPSNKKPPLASKILNASAISKINFSPVRFHKPPLTGETRHPTTAPAQDSPLSSLGNAFRRTDQQNNGVKGSVGSKYSTGPSSSRAKDDTIKHVKSVLPTRSEFAGLKPTTLKKQIEENQRISSAPALPARSSLKPPLNQPKQTHNFSSTLSSASRMVKDRLGMVFAGRNVGNPKRGTKPTAEDDTSVPLHKISEYSDNAKLARCHSHSTYDRFGRSMPSSATQPASSAVPSASGALESGTSNLQGVLGCKVVPSSYSGFASHKQQAPGAFYSHSQGVGNSHQPSAVEATISNEREAGTSETLPFRAKPSGLRMPSPKLGFFDKAKSTNTAPVAALRERTNGFGYDGGTLQSARYGGTAQLPIDVSRQSSSNSYGASPQEVKLVSNPITVCTDVNGPGRQTFMQRPPIPSKNPDQPRVEHGLPQIAAAPHLHHFDTSCRPEPSLTLTKGSATGSVTRSSSAASGLSSNSFPTTYEPTSFSSLLAGSDMGTTLQVKKNVENVLPAVKKMVNKLNLSPLQIIQQENLPLEQPQITGAFQHLSAAANEELCSKGDIGRASTTEIQEIGGAFCSEIQEEWPEVKSGAVQHSPTHKEPPKYGPWSPVRRNAPELGPFDCTKYNNNNTATTPH